MQKETEAEKGRQKREPWRALLVVEKVVFESSYDQIIIIIIEKEAHNSDNGLNFIEDKNTAQHQSYFQEMTHGGGHLSSYLHI